MSATFTVHQSDLKKTLTRLKRVAPTRSVRGFTNVRIRVNGVVELSVTDGEIYLTETPDGGNDAHGNFEVLVDFKKLQTLVGKLKGELTFNLGDHETIVIRSGSSEYRLPSEGTEEFPEGCVWDDPADDEETFQIPADRLGYALEQTMYATDVDSTRYALGGVCFTAEGEDLALAATDSRRLSVFHTTVYHNHADSEFQFIIPKEALNALVPYLKGNGNVYFHVGKNHVVVRSAAGWGMYARQLEGRFPKYQDVIPDINNLDSIVVDVDEFVEAVKAAQVITDEDHRGIDVCLDDGQGELHAINSDGGSCKAEFTFSGPFHKFEIKLDPRLLLDWFQTCGASTANIYYSDNESPVVLTTYNASTCVVMCLATDGNPKKPVETETEPETEDETPVEIIDVDEPAAVTEVPDPGVETTEGSWDEDGDFEEPSFEDDDDDDEEDAVMTAEELLAMLT